MSAVEAGRPPTTGLLLAAGAGRRAGGPKALRSHPDGTPWLVRSLAVLRTGGCDAVVVVLGAESDRARELLPPTLPEGVRVVVATDWAAGLGATLRVGLAAVAPGHAVLVHLVDLPDVSAEVVRRVLTDSARPAAQVLARAAYRGVPGHPVLIGPDHRDAVGAELRGDRGAQAYLTRHPVQLIECGDLATGLDQDH